VRLLTRCGCGAEGGGKAGAEGAAGGGGGASGAEEAGAGCGGRLGLLALKLGFVVSAQLYIGLSIL